MLRLCAAKLAGFGGYVYRSPLFASALAVLALATVCLAGHNNNNNNNNAVGGISISPEGVVNKQVEVNRIGLRDYYRENLMKIPAELNKPTEMRKVSLKQLEAAVKASGKNLSVNQSEDIRFMAGLQRVEYILVYPELGDIVLVGPGEGWKVDDNANYVGVTTGRPVVRLEDFVVALRTVDNARQGGITCSIDPTAEGRQRLDQLLGSVRQFGPGVLDGIEKALGPQQVTVTGVPATSRFARTLVASDFKMKRIAMKLDASPVAGLPSFLDMMKGGLDNMMPRWWIATDYEPLAKSEDGLAWQIRGRGVKVMTEDEFIGDDGSVTGTGKVNPIAQKWADKMTEKYEELSVADPVFGDLRNAMDLCVVAALIAKEGLLEKANLKIPTLLGEDNNLAIQEFSAAKTIDTQCSFVKRGREFVITASGGVEISSWQACEKSEISAEVKKVHSTAAPAGNSIWWN
ncbi:protein of unknown function DUF1598 [Pirellula staleyi DSM 6068]|uniref:DUF1598 domain-containing protein n=1 Tax=Pirellula staleyi (strain ATCC 27377 / DSM 6068 / ICPB 4128) TaxID=530564 RepID=D2QZ63_PIRSD|nr:DUF1598 domain-containing protein [Pirellula staleyi]ADB18255.1 protein of unknown function DUF1598 [Pirellula staleyi DSM 6068]